MIVFTNPGGMDPDKIRMAYNNDIVKFYSDTLQPQRYCDVTAPGLSIRLYPAPDGTFFLNFKPFVTALINTRYFVDDLTTDLDVTDPETFIYDFTDGVYMYRTVTFTIALDNDTEDTEDYILSWMAGVQQIGEYVRLSRSEDHVLLPFKKDTANTHYAKYWQGYPFDISLYLTGANLYIDNTTNMLTAEFERKGFINRLFLSDGRTDETIEDVLPLVESHNLLRAKKQSGNTVNDKFIALYKQSYKCGVYMKWLNNFGGYSYWLFEDTYALDRASKSIGELDNDTNNLNDAVGRTLNLGQQGNDTIKVIAELLTDDDMAIVQGVIDSPKVYMFIGQPFAKSDTNDWVEVTLKTNSARIKNFKQKLTNVALDFDLPERYTQTL